MLTTATTYEVSSVGGLSGSLSTLRLAARRSRTDLIHDDNEITYLIARLTVVEEKETTEMAWRDTAET